MIGRHHFVVPPDAVRDGVVELTGEEAHHAARVLRVKRGESITVADGTGRVYAAVVTDVDRVVRAEVQSVRTEPIPAPAVTLYQAVPKGERMDEIVEKAVEIGVMRIVPIMSERTVVRWREEKRAKAQSRWEAIARAAAKQCRSAHLTSIAAVCDGLDSALTATTTRLLVLHEPAETKLRDALPATTPDAIAIAVGPEGGFSQTEVETLKAGGAAAVTLGPRVLRTDTAGLVAATIIGYTYGTLG